MPRKRCRSTCRVSAARFGPEDVVQTRPGGYIVAADADNFDLPRFEALGRARTRSARIGRGGARAALVEALALWRGAPLAEFAGEPFARAEIARLDELRAGVLEARVAADLALGAHAALVAELEALVDRYPLRERLREQLMLALYRAGRQAEALGAYRDARSALVEELGIEPGRTLQELEQAILRQDPSLDPGTLQARPGRRAAGAFCRTRPRGRRSSQPRSTTQPQVAAASSSSAARAGSARRGSRTRSPAVRRMAACECSGGAARRRKGRRRTGSGRRRYARCKRSCRSSTQPRARASAFGCSSTLPRRCVRRRPRSPSSSSSTTCTTPTSRPCYCWTSSPVSLRRRT